MTREKKSVVKIGINILQPAHKHKQIRLLALLRKITYGTAGNDEALFNPDLPLQLRKGNKLHLTTFTEHICQK